MEKQYKDFDEMMTDLQGVTMDEAVKMKMTKNLKSLKGVDAGEGSIYQLEDHGGYASIFACHDTNDMVREIAEKFDLQVVTYSIGDAFSYSTGMHFVNRERYMFCRSKADGFCEEEMEESDEEE
jgi:hypothetical protein